MSVDALLSKLEQVRKTGRGKWLARCCAHDDGKPSLAIAEEPDGRVLVHCFAGCSVYDVLDASGVAIEELFPPRPIEHAPKIRRPFNAHDVLAAICDETLIVTLVALRLSEGKPIAPEHRERLLVANERLQAARRLVDG